MFVDIVNKGVKTCREKHSARMFVFHSTNIFFYYSAIDKRPTGLDGQYHNPLIDVSKSLMFPF